MSGNYRRGALQVCRPCEKLTGHAEVERAKLLRALLDCAVRSRKEGVDLAWGNALQGCPRDEVMRDV